MRYFWFIGLLALLVESCTAPTPQQDDSLVRIRWAHDPESLDPLSLPTQNAIDATNLLYLGLLQVDYQTQQYAPALAEALPRVQLIGDSLTKLDFHLRAAATWDDGHPVLATDVAFTLKLIYCPSLPTEVARAQFGFIQEVRVDPADPRHFVLVCRGQALEYAYVAGDFPILPEAALDSTHSLRRFSLAAMHRQDATKLPAALLAVTRRYRLANPARYPEHLPGCGPYRLAEWQPNSYLLFRRKKHWWADQLRPAPLVLQAWPQQLKFLILPDAAAATLALRRHELDVYPQVDARDFQRLRASAADQQELAFYTVSSYDIVTAGFNTQQPRLHDKLTRQALSCLFDPAGLLAGTQMGQGIRTVGLLAPTSPYYNDSLALPAFDLARAALLLRQAGWYQAHGTWQRQQTQQLSLSVRYRADDATFGVIALQFRAAAAKLGIPISLRPTEPAAMTAALQQGDFDVYIRTLKGNPFGFNFTPILHSRAVGEGNFTGFGYPATDHLLEEVAAAGPPARKRRLLRRFQAMLQDEAPLVPLFLLPYRLATSRRLTHVYPSGIKPGYATAALTWAKADSVAAR